MIPGDHDFHPRFDDFGAGHGDLIVAVVTCAGAQVERHQLVHGEHTLEGPGLVRIILVLRENMGTYAENHHVS